jgi:hypothetical protein
MDGIFGRKRGREAVAAALPTAQASAGERKGLGCPPLASHTLLGAHSVHRLDINPDVAPA